MAAIALDGVEPLRARGGRIADTVAGVELRQHLVQEGAHVRHQPERDRVIAGDLVGIDVDMDELGRRDGEGVAGQPRARGAVVEAHAERKQHVGGARGVVGLIGAVAGDEPERQRMTGVDRAGAARRPGDGNAQPLREPQQVGGGAPVFDALADQDNRLLGR